MKWSALFFRLCDREPSANAFAFANGYEMMSGMVSSDAPRIRTEVQVMFFDTDCAAVVHNIAYLRFIEIARTLLAENLGLGLTQMATDKKYPVVVRTEIDYRRPAQAGRSPRRRRLAPQFGTGPVLVRVPGHAAQRRSFNRRMPADARDYRNAHVKVDAIARRVG